MSRDTCQTIFYTVCEVKKEESVLLQTNKTEVVSMLSQRKEPRQGKERGRHCGGVEEKGK
jgi:hypothetical protein